MQKHCLLKDSCIPVQQLRKVLKRLAVLNGTFILGLFSMAAAFADEGNGSGGFHSKPSQMNMGIQNDDIPPALKSQLNERVEVEGFGEIAFRRPLPTSQGPAIVLFHGIYGGASHRAFREILPLLDAQARVYILDLPGAGESDRPKREYDSSVVSEFVQKFLFAVVNERATIVAEATSSLQVLEAANKVPQVADRVVLLSPGGVVSGHLPPSARENELFERLYNNDAAGIAFYESLLQPEAVRYFLSFGYFNDALIDEIRVAESVLARASLEQRWLTFSFVGGRLYSDFRTIAPSIFVPTMLVFGAEAENFATSRTNRAEDFLSIRPDFATRVVSDSGSVVHREKPEEVAAIILEFAQPD